MMWLGAGALLAGEADHGGRAALDVRLRHGPRRNAGAHGGLPRSDCWPAPAGPIPLNGEEADGIICFDRMSGY